MATVDEISSELLEKEWKECFMIFNKSGTGQLGAKEVGIVSSALGHTRNADELRRIVGTADDQGKGYLEYERFASLMSQRARCSAVEEEYIEELFKQFDTNGDGFISGLELKNGIKAMGNSIADEEIDEMMREADCDGDGRLAKEEFADVIAQALLGV